MHYRELKTKLAALEAEMTAVRAEGEILIDARIDSSKPGGTTARGQPSLQYRLRIKGQKARYLKAVEVAKTRTAIARGKRLKQLEREQQRVQAQLDQLIVKVAALGLELPE
ncbi:MAG: hypothetical protein H7Z11_15130 [Verrucomicrobia bacterium]|nr:hypothetical protein [Leptolyngbya sp. ES-bin-22]